MVANTQVRFHPATIRVVKREGPIVVAVLYCPDCGAEQIQYWSYRNPYVPERDLRCTACKKRGLLVVKDS